MIFITQTLHNVNLKRTFTNVRCKKDSKNKNLEINNKGGRIIHQKIKEEKNGKKINKKREKREREDDEDNLREKCSGV